MLQKYYSFEVKNEVLLLFLGQKIVNNFIVL